MSQVRVMASAVKAMLPGELNLLFVAGAVMATSTGFLTEREAGFR